MIQKHQNILIQGWMLDYIEGMSAEDGKKYLHCLIESAAAGEVITDNPLWKYWLEKSLSAIEETRAKYYAKAKKNGEKGKEYGIQGKEYGILGKEYGKLGGRPRKGETKEQYAERKKEENAEWEKQQELCSMITAEQGLSAFIKAIPQNQLQELMNEYVSKGYTKSQVIKAFEYIKSKNE